VSLVLISLISLILAIDHTLVRGFVTPAVVKIVSIPILSAVVKSLKNPFNFPGLAGQASSFLMLDNMLKSFVTFGCTNS